MFADYSLTERYDLQNILLVAGLSSLGLILLIGIFLLLAVKFLAKYRINNMLSEWQYAGMRIHCDMNVANADHEQYLASGKRPARPDVYTTGDDDDDGKSETKSRMSRLT